MYEFSKVKEMLIQRLESRGMEHTIIPGFMRSLACSILFNPQMNLVQVNEKLNYLGWNDFELDYHTLQLAKACLEVEPILTLNKIGHFAKVPA